MEEVRLSTREMMRRFDALNMQGPLSRFDSKHFQTQANPVLLAFLRMPGDNKPWGVAFGRALDDEPRAICALDPFSREDYLTMVETLGQYLDDEWGISERSKSPLTYPPQKTELLPQVWLPDSSHVEMLRLLSYSAFDEYGTGIGDTNTARLGRLAEFLFEESNYKGQQVVLNARDVMNQMWVIPADDFSLGHIGYLTAWIKHNGDIDSRRHTALQASSQSYSATLDSADVPQGNDSALVNVILGGVGSDGSTTRTFGAEGFHSEMAAQELRDVLLGQLELRWTKLKESWTLVTADPRRVNAKIPTIMSDSISRFDKCVLGEREGKLASSIRASPPRTDVNAETAALKYLKMLKAEEQFICHVVHDDKELLRDLFVEGTAFIARVSDTFARTVEDREHQFWEVVLPQKFVALFKRRASETYRVLGTLDGTLEATLLDPDEGEAGQVESADARLLLRWNKDGVLGSRANKTLSAPESLDLNMKVSDPTFIGKEIIFVPSFAPRLFDAAIEAAEKSKRGRGKWIYEMSGVDSKTPQNTTIQGTDVILTAIEALSSRDECAHIVRAAPGSGKSFNLLSIAKALVDQGHLVAIAAQTNNQAADLCRNWSQENIGGDPAKLVRFVSTLIQKPAGVEYGWVSRRDDLPTSGSLIVSTAAKWGQNYLVNKDRDFYALLVDEAFQMSWSTFVQVSNLSSRFLLVGDAGQIPPVVPIDARRWDIAPIPPHWAAPNVFSHNLTDGRVSINVLDACWRLPSESVEYIQDFYGEQGLAVVADKTVETGGRGLTFAVPPAGDLADALLMSSGSKKGFPVVIELPNDGDGPPLDRDSDVASQIAAFVEQLFRAKPETLEKQSPLTLSDVAVCSTKRATNALIESALNEVVERLKADKSLNIIRDNPGNDDFRIRVDTPERMQGLQYEVFIAVHPMTNVTHPSEFDLETGRLCVMASRHRQALFMFTRSHLRNMLNTARIVSGHAPSGRDITGIGLRNHKRFLERVEAQGTWVTLS